jgi:hypothetical protein
VRLSDLRVLNADVVAADVVDPEGEQVTAMAFELEQRRAFSGTWSGRAAIVAFAPDAEFFPTEEDFAASASSLLDPDADLDEEAPPSVQDQGMPWPLRMASDSFISYALFADPADAEAIARVNGIVTSAELRTNDLTGDAFLACRISSLGSELDLVTVPPAGFLPRAGSVVAATAFLVASIDALEFPDQS